MARKPMTAAHKEALAQGRAAGRAVRAYLEALESSRPKRGRKVPTDVLVARLDETNEAVNNELNPLRRLHLVQQALDLETELEHRGADGAPDLASLEAEFVKYAKPYSESKGITFAAWREVGVPPSVLKSAGITRS